LPSESEFPAISVQNLSITYRTTFEKRPTLKESLRRAGRGKRVIREVEAVKNVSFDLPRSRVLGIVGNNGAGKSTLVRAIAGILPPTAGRIEIRGRVSTLLALGVGFNSKLSGYENVMLGGLAAGYTRAEVEEKTEEIAAWTELGDFLEMPMNTYSSGMYSRLAFAVAVHMEPDILIVDEALSTGDASFKAKAMAKMDELLEQAHTMVLVSHALETVQHMCTDAIWLDKGNLMMVGQPAEVIAAYNAGTGVDPNAVTTRQDF
jgi:lipopolysaccharide transport system ATP-binding protein/teichoic acid transport system ATP-binding protein